MGVFKNDVGRPSNKTIKTRTIFKAILLIILILLIVSVCLFMTKDNKNNKEQKNNKKNINNTVSVNKKTYTIKFKDDEELFEIKVQKGDFLKKPDNPIKEGYVFIGWYVGEKEYDFSKVVENDLVLKAKWKKESVEEQKINDTNSQVFTVTFDYATGKNDKQSVIEGEKVIKPSEPVREGYLFTNWTLNGQAYNFDQKITKNITLVASWEKIASFNENILSLATLNYSKLSKKLGGVSRNDIKSATVYNTAKGRGYNSGGYVRFNNDYVGYYEFWTFESEDYNSVLNNISTKFLIVPAKDLFNDYSSSTLSDKHLKAMGVNDIVRVPERNLLQFKYSHYTIEYYDYGNSSETYIWDKNYKANW